MNEIPVKTGDFSISKLSSAGGIHIPTELRKRLGIQIGQKFVIYEVGGNIVMSPMGSMEDYGYKKVQEGK